MTNQTTESLMEPLLSPASLGAKAISEAPYNASHRYEYARQSLEHMTTFHDCDYAFTWLGIYESLDLSEYDSESTPFYPLYSVQSTKSGTVARFSPFAASSSTRSPACALHQHKAPNTSTRVLRTSLG